MSDHADLKAPCRGYYLSLGGTEDEISLYRQDGNTSVLVVDGRDGALNSAFVNVNIRVRRDSAFRWHLLRDTAGGTAYLTEGMAMDSTYKSSAFFGVFCKYTSTRSDKFSFDNFSVSGVAYKDEQPPYIISDSLLSSDKWGIRFSEKLDPVSLVPSHFTLLNSGEKAISIQADTGMTYLVVQFENAFSHGNTNCLEAGNIMDVAGNLMETIVLCRFYSDFAKVPFKGLVISEVMPDPEPALSLPPVEYLEIMNRTAFGLDLGGWYVTDRKDSCRIENEILPPASHLLICDTGDSSQWLSHEVLKCSCKLPSLNNDKDTLLLLDPSGRVIDSMTYEGAQFIDNELEGGVSLELMDTAFICTDTSKWALSASAPGGSPGLPNSIYDIREKEGLGIESFEIVSDSLIRVCLSGHAHPGNLLDQCLSFLPQIDVASIGLASGNILDIRPVYELEDNAKYTLNLASMADCYGDTIDDLKAGFINPGRLDSGDLRINEILFNPATGGSDFIEIFNVSSDYIDLRGISLLNNKEDTAADSWTERYGREILPPGQFIVFTEDSSYISSHYLSASADRIRMAELPSWNDDFGSAFLLNGEDEVIDMMFYSGSMHFALIKDNEGISLERISPLMPATDRSNWTSASTSSGYATPGNENSQYTAGKTGHFNISPGLFSPDNDGYQDLVSINYGLQKSACTGNITIYDDDGRLIRELVTNEILDAEGFYTWNGLDGNNQKAGVGYYMVVFEYICSDGGYGKERASVVLAHRMD